MIYYQAKIKENMQFDLYKRGKKIQNSFSNLVFLL